MSLPIIIIEKAGTLKTMVVKEYKEEDLFKKCGFKSANGFAKLHEWTGHEPCSVALYGKTTGKPDAANLFAFPATLACGQIFGNAVIVGYKNGTPVPLTLATWEAIRGFVASKTLLAQPNCATLEPNADDDDDADSTISESSELGDDAASDVEKTDDDGADDDDDDDDGDDDGDADGDDVSVMSNGNSDDDSIRSGKSTLPAEYSEALSMFLYFKQFDPETVLSELEEDAYDYTDDDDIADVAADAADEK